MKSSVIIFPGSNCDRDMDVALKKFGFKNQMIWHNDNSIPKSDIIVLPGGFSYGDYLRCGSMAANSPIMSEIIKNAENGAYVIGICNGFQILTETNLLPGTLIRNRELSFICKNLLLKVENSYSSFTHKYSNEEVIEIPVAHNEGNYFADQKIIDYIEDNNLIVFRYCDQNGVVNDETNPNGSRNNIAGIINEKGNILGMMPHPERATDQTAGLIDGEKFFTSILESIQ